MTALPAIPTALTGFSFQVLAFDRAGTSVDRAQVDAVRALGTSGLADRVTDLVVVAHGWNNDDDEALTLYTNLAASMAAVLTTNEAIGSALSGRRLGLVGVLWPSKRFADAELIPGGAAVLGGQAEQLTARIDELRGAFDAPDADARLDAAAALIPELEDSPTALEAFIEQVRGLVPDSAFGPETEDHDAADLFRDLTPDTIASRLADPALGDPQLEDALLGEVAVQGTEGGAGPDGGVVLATEGPRAAADLGSAALLGLPPSPLDVGRRWLNLTTYYQMKQRAGLVGARGLAPSLSTAVSPGQRLHLAGHSFGARLVTAAAARLQHPVASICLLQAAFSHYAFARDWEPARDGAFRGVLSQGRLVGPMIVTHTRNDHAVGVAYALASRLARQVASAIGDARSRYGGLGSNGAQRTPEAYQETLHESSHRYNFAGGKVYNLLADHYIANHGDVTGQAVANAALAAIASAPP
jgi:predicted alpha/beta hydrolase family esterase